MKINRIYISAFGKLKNFTLELDDKMNVIYGENENGKSTIMAFIKMMFYGSGGRKAQQIAANPRIKYLPWSGESMGGRIFFTHAGHNYCLEREFKKSDSSDRIKLTDLDLGCDIPTEGCPGLQFFSIGADAFEKSVFVGAIGAPAANEKADGELNAKLSNIVLTGDEDTSYQTVVSRLEEAQYSIISKSGRTGSLVKGTQQLNALKEQLELANQALQKKNELTRTSTALKEQLKADDARLKEMKILLQKEDDIKSAQRLEEYLEKKKELDQLNGTLTLSDGSLLDDRFVKSLDFCLTRLKDEERKGKELNSTLERLRHEASLASEGKKDDTKSKLDAAQKNIENFKAQKASLESELQSVGESLTQTEREAEAASLKRKAFNPLFLILGIIALVAGIVVLGILKQFIIGGIIAAAGAILIALGFIIRPLDNTALSKYNDDISALKNKQADITSKIAEIQGEISETASDISLLSAALNTDAAANARRDAEMTSVMAAIEENGQKRSSALNDIAQLSGRLNTECDPEKLADMIPELEKAAQKQKEIKLRLGYLSSDLGGLSYQEAEEKLKTINALPESDTDFDKVRSEYEELSSKISETTTQLTAVLTEIRTGFSNINDINDIKSKIDALTERLEGEKQFYDAAAIAVEELGQSFAEVRSGYGSELENQTLDIFSRLTGGKYGSVSVSKSMDITVEEKGVFGTREIDYLSLGTADQAYLSLRLALSKLISEEPLPVLLDDVLSQYDDRRTKEAVEYLHEYSQERQTVLFTCHRFICETADSLGVSITEL